MSKRTKAAAAAAAAEKEGSARAVGKGKTRRQRSRRRRGGACWWRRRSGPKLVHGGLAEQFRERVGRGRGRRDVATVIFWLPSASAARCSVWHQPMLADVPGLSGTRRSSLRRCLL